MPPKKRRGKQQIFPMSQHNALQVIIDEINRNKVKAALPPLYDRDTDYNLIVVRAQVNLLEEFLAAFGNSLEVLAKKIISPELRWCDYGVFLGKNYRKEFAFNMLFAEFDFDITGIVKYRQPQDVLADLMTERGLAIDNILIQEDFVELVDKIEALSNPSVEEDQMEIPPLSPWPHNSPFQPLPRHLPSGDSD